MPDSIALSSQANKIPLYVELVKFLIEPFLDSPESLSIDCEELNQNQRVWVRLAFEGSDKGKVFGRGGRNIQAIRKILETTAIAAGQTLYLDIYENRQNTPPKITKKRDNDERRGEQGRRKHRTRNSTAPKLSTKSRF